VKSLVAVISDISERKELEAQLRSLAQELMVFQEEERKSIGRELHDEIGQLLTGLKLSIGLAESTAPKEHKASLKLPAQLVDQTFERVRALTQGLRPSMLDDLGLEPTLRWLFREVRKQTGLKITATIEGLGSHCSLSPECRIAAFRIVQEALTNVARHSGAKTAHVTVSRREDRLELSVEDKGSGFEPLAPGAKRMGTGLTGMQERVRALRGEFDILTQVGGGTIIRASWPAPENGMRRKAVRSASSVDTSSF
jgi:signal transduction histidine kinase